MFEEVDEWTYTHQTEVIRMSGGKETPRYTGLSVSVGEGVEISGPVTIELLGIICRFLDVTIPTGMSLPGGFLRTPETLVIVPKRGLRKLRVGGVNYVQQKDAA